MHHFVSRAAERMVRLKCCLQLVLFTQFFLISITPTMAGKNRLKFIVVGDIGGTSTSPYYTSSQWRVSYEMAKIPDVDFIVGVGDNFYFQGVRDLNDYRFFWTFEYVYRYLELQKDWYMIAGNHDYEGNVSAQIMYTQWSRRWKFPHYFYTKVFNVPNSKKTLQIVMLDTNLLCSTWLAKKKQAPLSQIQMKWIKQTLENSKADYLLVAGHHPLYSVGWHGMNECPQDKLENLFQKHQVTAYFSGHDHNLQHIKLQNTSVEYFVVGTGCYFRPGQPNRASLGSSLKYFVGDSPGFVVVTATPKHLEIKFHTVRTARKYRRILRPRRQHKGNCKNKDTNFTQLLKDFFHSVKNNR